MNRVQHYRFSLGFQLKYTVTLGYLGKITYVRLGLPNLTYVCLPKSSKQYEFITFHVHFSNFRVKMQNNRYFPIFSILQLNYSSNRFTTLSEGVLTFHTLLHKASTFQLYPTVPSLLNPLRNICAILINFQTQFLTLLNTLSYAKQYQITL